ncbi:MAG: uroporphyrinogen decarboxylase family protein [Candidatus Omnitrophica bacterium]|nr:uroporphyrinogen decarboxylase family protein [Candidatus Omnitrophota bacterium]
MKRIKGDNLEMTKKLTRRGNFFRIARREGEGQWQTLDFAFSQGAKKTFEKYAGKGTDPCEYFNFDGRWLGISPTKRQTPDWKNLYYKNKDLPKGINIDPEWGIASAYLKDTDDQLSFPPLKEVKTVEEIKNYPWPDIDTDYRWKDVAGKVEDVKKSDHIAFLGTGVSIFESAWGIRGFEEFMMDMAEGNGIAESILDKIYDITIRCAQNVAKSGSDVLQSGSDVATQRGPLMSKKMWRDYLFPIMKDSIKEAKKIKPDILVIYHSCGNVMDLVEGFIEAGIDILNPLQPEAMDIFELKRRYGDVLTFHGGIGVQSVLPFGTPQQVRDITRKTIDIMGKGGGYLCSASHNIRPETPWENVMAFVETVREYGKPPPLEHKTDD